MKRTSSLHARAASLLPGGRAARGAVVIKSKAPPFHATKHPRHDETLARYLVAHADITRLLLPPLCAGRVLAAWRWGKLTEPCRSAFSKLSDEASCSNGEGGFWLGVQLELPSGVFYARMYKGSWPQICMKQNFKKQTKNNCPCPRCEPAWRTKSCTTQHMIDRAQSEQTTPVSDLRFGPILLNWLA